MAFSWSAVMACWIWLRTAVISLEDELDPEDEGVDPGEEALEPDEEALEPDEEALEPEAGLN